MDFIGQKGPSSKIHLLLLDFLVLALQLLHLSAHLLRQKLRLSLLVDDTVAAVASDIATPSSTAQTVEDEERGVRQSAEEARGDEIEMQTLNSAGVEAASAVHDEDEQTRLEAFRQPARTEAHIFDAFNSGQMVIADLSPVQTVKEQIIMIRVSKTDPEVSSANERAMRHRQMRQRLTQRLWQRLQM